MIYAIQRLNRPTVAEFSTHNRVGVLRYRDLGLLYGRSNHRKYSFDHSQWLGAVACGWAPPESIASLELYRTLEWYTCKPKTKTVKVGGKAILTSTGSPDEVFVERLCARIGNDKIIPYKIRYRIDNVVENYIFPRGIGAVCNALRGLPLDTPRFIDPRTHFLISASETANSGPAAFLGNVIDQAAISPIAMDVICPDAYTLESVATFVTPLAEVLAVITAWDHQGSQRDIDDVVTNDLTPQLPQIPDVITAEAIAHGHLNRDYLRHKIFGGVIPVDTSIPGYLHLPETGVMASLPEHVHLAEMFDRIILTDFDIIYPNGIGDPGKTPHRIISRMADRYAGRFDAIESFESDDILEQIDEIVRGVQVLFGKTYEFRVVKTHNEEALIECRDHHRRPATTLHFDLALLSLCSFGVADVDDLVPGDLPTKDQKK